MPDVIRAAQPRDLPAVQTLLEAVGLPTVGVAQHLREFLVVEDPGRSSRRLALSCTGPLRCCGRLPCGKSTGIAAWPGRSSVGC